MGSSGEERLGQERDVIITILSDKEYPPSLKLRTDKYGKSLQFLQVYSGNGEGGREANIFRHHLIAR